MAINSLTLTAVGVGQVVPIDLKRFQKGVGVLITITGTLTCKVQVTADNVQGQRYTPAAGNWNDHDTLINLTTSANGNLEYPVAAVRLSVTAYTSGSATIGVVQAEG